MTEHVADHMPGLLSGEASREEVGEAAKHLPGCPDCQHEMVLTVLAHASLASARRFAPELAAMLDMPELPDSDRLLGEIRSAPKRHRRMLAVAAAVLVVAGAGIATGLVATSAGPTGQHVALSAYGVGSVPASATLTGDELRVNAAALPALPAQQRYEIWLTDALRTRMQPVGWIGAGGRADITLPDELLHSFADVEVSIQSIDTASYLYSGRSVLRGSY